MMVCRGIRGATTASENTREAIFEATQELFNEIIRINDIQKKQVAAVFFTTTMDLNAAYPATAVRDMGWDTTALMCGHEIDVPGSLPLCVRILLMVNTEKNPEELQTVYLNGAINLRDDTLAESHAPNQ